METQTHIALFNDERYQTCNLRPDQRLFRHDHEVGGEVVGTLSGVVDGDILQCGHSAPFGGVDFVRSDVPLGVAMGLLDAACAAGRSAGIAQILMRSRAAYFGANETAMQFALLNRGAVVESCEATLGLEPWRYPTLADYEASLGASARWRIRRALATEMSFGPAREAEEWQACYALLAETRQRRGVRLSISFDYLMNMRRIFGDRIAMWRLTHGETLAGAALVYGVTRDWAYLVAWGDDLRYRPNGVVNLLAYHLVGHAIARKVGIIDLGISSVDGVPDDGLIQFKRSVGAATGLRTNFRLPLA
jgi:Acetyltransferase (GNAT) domain